MMRMWFCLALGALLGGCANAPSNVGNICEIFREKGGWYNDAKKASQQWGSPIPTMMAMMHQESRFRAKAKPPRKYFLGIIPAGRISDAYGFAQAKDDTWDWYIDKSGSRGADRDDFDDAIDFVGWYNQQSSRMCHIKPEDTYHLYLAYHEGHGGFNRRTYTNKEWLKRVAHKVSARAQSYSQQLASCREELERGGWFFGWF
ncbi:MAG: hypothetical protein ACI9G5_000643 [Paracoccaceae bacterium]|jgi:hypothetical protein